MKLQYDCTAAMDGFPSANGTEPWAALPGCLVRLNLEDAMTDYRDPNYRDPTRPGGYRDPVAPADPNHWSTATWGWIAGISVVVLILIFAFGMGGEGDRTAKDTARPQTTTGQRALPPAPPAGAPAEAPSANPVPQPPAPPAKK
jgi:hypothetical protein